MIRINQIKLNVCDFQKLTIEVLSENPEIINTMVNIKLKTKIIKALRIREDELLSFSIRKQSIDARKKPEIYYVYSVDVKLRNETGLASRLKQLKNPNIVFLNKTTNENVHLYAEKPFCLGVKDSRRVLTHRPVIIGTGPAGLFCGYQLALLGYRPILLERGASVDERMRDVERFWTEGLLNPNSNVQFGEGGAGTFSDGKLNTLVHDASGRGTRVLEIFVEMGAPEEILYQNKPHIGTDILAKVVKNMREFILSHGGDVRFHSQVTELIWEDMRNPDSNVSMEDEIAASSDENEAFPRLTSLRIRNLLTGEESLLETRLAVLAIGHSARDTFTMLYKNGIPMAPKAFAVGVRMEHPQEMINENQYGTGYPDVLPAAEYKLTANLPSGRGVYTFCMCPGGYVVNASSEPGHLAVNGMSYHGRKGHNANSAVVVTITPEDCFRYNTSNTLRPHNSGDSEKAVIFAGMEFQRHLEEAAYREGRGKIPTQLFEDFCKNCPSEGAGAIEPQMKGTYTWSNVRSVFPEELAASLEEGIRLFDRKIPGYARPDSVVSGVESRTSSPVRILRDETLQSRIQGLYPCGEGAGYAGGITSAAMDGLKIAETIVKKYQSFDKQPND